MSTYLAILTKISKVEYSATVIIAAEEERGPIKIEYHIERIMRRHGFSEQQIIEVRNVKNGVKTIYTESRKIGSKKLIIMNANIANNKKQ